MCGIVGVLAHAPVNQVLYDALLLLQHRGQQAAGIASDRHGVFSMHKANGMVSDVFRTRHMRTLRGHSGIGHCSCAASGPSCDEEAQPFYVNAPFGITLAHNGSLANGAALRAELAASGRRHVNTGSDAEVLLNVLAHELHAAGPSHSFDIGMLFTAVAGLQRRVQGSYAAVAQIAGQGLLAFRDPRGIRPLCMGVRESDTGSEYMLASESVALEGMGFHFLRDIAAGEAVFIDSRGALHARQCAQAPALQPCAFEYVSLARPDSILDGASVYAVRLKLGEHLATAVRRELGTDGIDVVMPVSDSARPAAIQLALKLNLTYREGFMQNRYLGRAFQMPELKVTRKPACHRLNAIAAEFRDKRVLLVEDAIVDGNSSADVVRRARAAGAMYVALASTAPPVLYPKVYGVDWPAQRKPAALGEDLAAMRGATGADALVFQQLAALKEAVASANPALRRLETSCFDGME
ncbi:MAG: amidophosphoribosyltransferase [Pseudomonadota bacterium]